MLERFGLWTYRLRWTIVILWVTVFAAGAFFAPRVTDVLRGGGYTIGNSQSITAYNVLNRTYGYRALIFTVVFTGPPSARSEESRAASAFRRRALARFPGQLMVQKPVWTPDHAVVFERVYSSPQSDLGAGFAGPLRSLLPRGRVHGYLSGSAAIFHDMEVVSDQDLHRIELVTLPLALVVLLLIFGSVVASALPVLMAPISVSVALALIYLIGHKIDMSIFVLNTTSMVGLGVAIDYSLFMVHRFRDEIAVGRDLETAVAHTVATSGRAILVSAIVVTVGFLGLTLSGVAMLSSLGIGGSVVTALSLILAVTLLPAVLGILGERINFLPVVPRRLNVRRAWRRVALAVMQRPVVVIVGVAAVVLVLAWPARHLRPGVPGPEILPSSVDSRAGNNVLVAHLGAASEPPVLVVVQRHPGTPPTSYRSAAFAVLDHVCSSSVVVGVASLPVADSPRQIRSCNTTLAALQRATPTQRRRAVALARRRSVGLISAFLTVNPSSAAAEHYVSTLRHSTSIPGYAVWIGGQTAGQMDFDSYLFSRFPLVILFVVVTIYVVLLISFRSVLLPLKAVLMNVFSVLAAYGAAVWAFQDAHLSGVLGFTPVGNLDALVPVFLFCVLFGLSTDYEVFLLTRVREEYLASGNNEESVATGLEVTGRIITSAAAVMIVVFGAFAFARLVIVKEVGLGLAVAMLVDATLIRALLVPATMRLLGRWNWWLPGRGFPRVPESSPIRATGRPPAAS